MKNNILGDKKKDEKKLIDAINKDFNKKREEIYKNPEIEKAWSYLKKQNKLYDSFIDKFGKKAERLDKVETSLKNDIKKQTLEKFLEFKKLIRLNKQNINYLQDALHPGHSTDVFDRGLIADGEFAVSPDYDYNVFEPPYEQLRPNETGDFDVDNSFSWPDWGTLITTVRFKLDDSWTNFSSSDKYSSNEVHLGVKYRMPRHGSLDVTVVIINVDNYFNYSLDDNWGSSYSCIDISNMIFVDVLSGGRLIYRDAATTVNLPLESDGEEDDKSGPFDPIAKNARILINFSTEHIHEGEDVEILVASWFRIYGMLNNMKAEIFTNLVWKVDKIYVRVLD